jgi:cytochrome c oxidase cbb3-type subunit 3
LSHPRHLIRKTLIALLLAAAVRADTAPAPDAVLRGRQLFVPACGFCHGNDATGSRGPDLVRSPLLSHDERGETIGPVIRAGRPDKGMPAFAYKDSQIADLAAFLHSQALAALRSASVPGDYPVRKLLTGNAAAGKTYFAGAGGCSGCHSATGDLAGIGRKYQPIELQSRFLYPRGSKLKAAVTLPSGEKFSGALVHRDEFNIALIDAAGWYRSWPADRVRIEVADPLAAHRALLYKYADRDVHNLFAYLESLK